MTYDQRYFESDMKLQGCSESFGNEYIEILLIPNFLAITLFHLPVKENMNLTIPVGYVTIDKEKINKITRNVASWAKQRNIFTNYFEKRDSDKKDSILNRIILPSLEINEE